MAFEPGRALRASPPVSSRSSSPANPNARAGAEDEALKKDKIYRRYASGVERALSLFDTALQEWADYISFLGRLLKALQARPTNVTVIPNKSMIAKRLAQCLNSNLPSGVHQKALEVYSYIFSTIGTEALSRDLVLYLPGLSSTLSFASLSVRPAFLTLAESFLVPLHTSALRPALKAIILCLLPGLEEESSEDFERTLRLLNEFRRVVGGGQTTIANQEDELGDQYFWQCLFLATITSPSKRTGALAYLVRSLPKLIGPPKSSHGVTNGESSGAAVGGQLSAAIENLLSPEPGLLIRCFAACLDDDQLLIQRGFLDLLVTHLPLHSIVLQERVTDEDLERLVIAAVGVVARRDMSLNRRLWTWFLGPTESSFDEESTPSSPNSPNGDDVSTTSGDSVRRRTRYFSQYGLEPLVNGIRDMINRNSRVPVERVRPFRICLSLMDRWEVGGLVIPNIFIRLVDSVRQFEDLATSRDDFCEVLRSSNVFFDGVESGQIWAQILGQLTAGLENNTDTKEESAQQSLALAKFMVTRFNLREEEMLIVHIPTVTLALLSMLEVVTESNIIPSPRGARADSEDIHTMSLSIAQRLIDMAPDRAFQTGASTQSSTSQTRQPPQSALQSREVVSIVRKFYTQDQGNLEISSPPFSSHELSALLVRGTMSLVIGALRSAAQSSRLEASVALLNAVLRKLRDIHDIRNDHLFSAIQQALKPATASSQIELPFPALNAIISCLASLSQPAMSNYCFTNEQLHQLIPILIRKLWNHLMPSNPKYHVEAVRCIWRLHAMTRQDRLVEASITTLMVDASNGGKSGLEIEACGRFAILWTHCSQLSHGLPETNTAQTSNRTDEFRRGEGVEEPGIVLTRPLFMLLDGLADEGTETFIFVRAWVQNLPNLIKIFYIIIAKLQSMPRNGSEANNNTQAYPGTDDIDECRYYLQTTRNLLRYSPETTWLLLANQMLYADDEQDERSSGGDSKQGLSFQAVLVNMCLQALSRDSSVNDPELLDKMSGLHHTTLLLIKQFYLGPSSKALMQLRLETILVGRLFSYLHRGDVYVQVALLDTLYAALRLGLLRTSPSLGDTHRRIDSSETVKSISRLSLSMERSDKEQAAPNPPSLPSELLECLLAGLSSQGSRPILDSWILFLDRCLQLYRDTVFQFLIPLVECLCDNIRDVFENLRSKFRLSGAALVGDPEPVLMLLLNGLEQSLARSHERLTSEEAKTVTLKSPEQPQGFFGNMVSGVFTPEISRSRTESANRRLTVLLCFKDTVCLCYDIWSWGGDGFEGKNQDPASVSSFNYTSIRLRNRARRTIEHLFAAEALECLETLIEIWRNSTAVSTKSQSVSVIDLLHALDGSRPKYTIPAVFNAIYTRTNPVALEPTRKSTLTSTLSDVELVTFLTHYARSVEDDAMDEIWNDCMTFLRDVLANPFPHRQTLPRLLEFTAILGEKVDNTIFGEQRRLRRDLGDVFTRLLTAIFTTKPLGFSQETPQAVNPEKVSLDTRTTAQNPEIRFQASSDDIVTILQDVIPNLPKILLDQDRIVATAAAISTNVIAPSFRSRSFPHNVSKSTLNVLHGISRLPAAHKSWKKDISDGFYDPKFFSTSLDLVETGWLPLLRQWVSVDKERIPDLISRLTSPTSAGIMFGVGASSARLEADRKTQLNLRRIALVILATPEDSFVSHLRELEDKLVELLTATAASSPSSATRAELYMVLRALLLTTSAVHLSSLWPAINAELQSAISSVLPGEHHHGVYNDLSILQACKLLDLLLTLAPEEFQLHEWLFITDTIDAVYKPSDWNPVALADRLSEQLGSTAATPSSLMAVAAPTTVSHGRRKPLLDLMDTKIASREDLVGRVLRPFFSQLSIYAFESTYGMGESDRNVCVKGLLADLFDDTTMAG